MDECFNLLARKVIWLLVKLSQPTADVLGIKRLLLDLKHVLDIYPVLRSVERHFENDEVFC